MFGRWKLMANYPFHQYAISAVSPFNRKIGINPVCHEATSAFGGIPELTAMLVLAKGIMGMLICEPLFNAAKVNSSFARGISLSATAPERLKQMKWAGRKGLSPV
jgi:putative effector of murein hydrolase